MIKFGLRRRRLSKYLINAVAPIALISITYIVWAKEPGLNNILNVRAESIPNLNEQEEPNLEKYDISSRFLYEVEGTASYYGKRFHSRLTANGERFDMYALTAAHKELPFGTILRVTNKNSNKTALVRINDRGPYAGKRILDLSYRSAKDIDGLGLPRVKIQALLPNHDAIEDTTNDYYFGYSMDKPLLCLPEELVNKVDSTKKFHTAVSKYNRLSNQNTDSEYYLMIQANHYQRNELGNTEYRYFIAEISEAENDKMFKPDIITPSLKPNLADLRN